MTTEETWTPGDDETFEVETPDNDAGDGTPDPQVDPSEVPENETEAETEARVYLSTQQRAQAEEGLQKAKELVAEWDKDLLGQQTREEAVAHARQVIAAAEVKSEAEQEASGDNVRYIKDEEDRNYTLDDVIPAYEAAAPEHVSTP